MTNRSVAVEQRKLAVYVGFTASRAHIRGHNPTRRKWLRHLSGVSFAVVQNKSMERRFVWETTAQYAFVASPPGNGFDCHRTWEALVLGCIVIVQNSSV